MRSTPALTAWLLCLDHSKAFWFPQIRARIERRIFAQDPALNNLLEEYQETARRVTAAATSPAVDIAPLLRDLPPTPSTVVDTPAMYPSLDIHESVVAQKLTVAEEISRATQTAGKVPTLAEWLTHGKDKLRVADPSLVASPGDAKNFNRVSNLSEKVSIMKQNLLSLTTGISQDHPGEKVHVFDSERIATFSARVAAGFASASSVATSSFDIKSFIDKLHIDQYGAWYVVIGTFIWGLVQRKAGKREIEDAFREELVKVEAKSNEAAEYATIAVPTKTIKRIPYNPNNDANKLVLEATKAKVLQMDMEKLKNDADKLKAETERLQSNLEKAEAKAAKVAELEAKLAAAEAQLAVRAKPDVSLVPDKESVDQVPVPAPVVVLEPITEVESVDSVPVPAPVVVPEPITEVESVDPVPVSSPVAVPEPITEVESVDPVPVPAPVVVPEPITEVESIDSVPVSAPVAVPEPVTDVQVPSVGTIESIVEAKASNPDVLSVSKAKPARKKIRQSKPVGVTEPVTGVQMSKSDVDTPELIIETEEAVSKPAPATEPVLEAVAESILDVEFLGAPESVARQAPKVAKAVATKKSKAVEKAKSVESANSEESPPMSESPLPKANNVDAAWASLSESSLKRKTVNELSEYLVNRGVSTTDAKGNTLKKAQLVEAVQKLL